MRQLRQRRNVRHFSQRIGRCFQKQQFCVGFNCRFPGSQVRECYETGIDAELRQVFIEQHDAGPEDTARRYHMIAALQQGNTGAQYRRHTGSGRNASLATLHRRETLLEGAYRGIGKARINITGQITFKARLCLGCTAEYITRSHKNRYRVFVLTGSYLPGTDSQCFQIPILFAHRVFSKKKPA